MLCENCKNNQATVHVKRVVNGEVKETYLCSHCAEKAGLKTSFSFNDMFKDLFSAASDVNVIGGGLNSGVKKCQSCGMTYQQFRQEGKLGCGECAEAFGAYMDSTLKNIHGSNEHKGKIPHKSGGKMMLKREKELLKKQMAEAVEREDFEEAAKIRDRLRSLEKDGE